MNTHVSLARRSLIATLAALAVLGAACSSGTTDLGDADPAPADQEMPADDVEVPGDPDSEEPTTDGSADVDDDVAASPDPADSTTKPLAPRPSASPSAEPQPIPASTPPPVTVVLADGTYEATLVTIDATSVTLDLVQVLSGQAAIDAAMAAGVPLDEDGTLPNDVYVEDVGERVTLPIAGDGGFQILDCHAGCELVGTTLDALLDGSAVPYGGANAAFTVLVDAGSVVSLAEIYLP